jgi:hypothetical protein
LKGGSLRAFRTGACLFESRIPEWILIFVRLRIPAISAQPRAVIVLVQWSGIRASMTLYSWAHRHSYLALFAHGLILHYLEVSHPVLAGRFIEHLCEDVLPPLLDRNWHETGCAFRMCCRSAGNVGRLRFPYSVDIQRSRRFQGRQASVARADQTEQREAADLLRCS